MTLENKAAIIEHIEPQGGVLYTPMGTGGIQLGNPQQTLEQATKIAEEIFPFKPKVIK